LHLILGVNWNEPQKVDNLIFDNSLDYKG